MIAFLQPQYSRACPHGSGFVTEPPSSPLSLAVEEVSENSVTLTWKAPEKTGRSVLDGYLVEICKDGSRLGLSCLVSVESCCVAAEVWEELGRTRQRVSLGTISLPLPNSFISNSRFFSFPWRRGASHWLQIVVKGAGPGLTSLPCPVRGWRRDQH